MGWSISRRPPVNKHAKAVILATLAAAAMSSEPSSEQIELKNKLDAVRQKIADEKALRKAEEKRRRKRGLRRREEDERINF
jgi:hypothetical protein